jgi:glycosyltransferase involved in cell wall biosynthesis
VDPSKVTVVRNGPELDRLRRVAPDDSLRDGSSLVLCFAGTIGPQDGVDHLIRAVHHLIHDEGRDDVRCFVVGDGDAVADLRQLARDLGVDGRVEFVGHQRHDELVRYICSADVCVEPAPSNPYNDRSTMIKVMEYLALGATVVAFDLPEHRVSAGECAVYVTPNDSAALAKAIAAIADDSGQRQSLSIQGHARARDHLAWDHNAVRLIEAYRLVLGPVR